MTYAGFLLRFLVVPILILGILKYLDRRRLPAPSISRGVLTPWRALAILILIALVYTTPWDNYLVATGVWWYDPALVTGVTFGWVPLEEYLFFVLQTVLTGLWFLLLARRVHVTPTLIARKDFRFVSAAVVIVIWLASVAILLVDWKPGNYLALELAWALPPIALQLAVGADILWHYRRIVIPTLVTATLYLSGMDSLAIHSGTWTINPEFTLGIAVAGTLPVEEIVFFLVTNTLLVFGLTLSLAHESVARLPLHITGRLTGRRWQSTP